MFRFIDKRCSHNNKINFFSLLFTIIKNEFQSSEDNKMAPEGNDKKKEMLNGDLSNQKFDLLVIRNNITISD